MWPFKRNSEPKGNVLEGYDLTPDEREYVRMTFYNFVSPEGRHIGLEPHSPEIRRGLIAYGLWCFAEQKMEAAGFYSLTPDKATKAAMAEKAIAAARKAYAIHHLPIYLYDLARYMKERGLVGPAHDMYRDFLLAHVHYKEGAYDHLFTRDRDIEQAVQDAKDSLSGTQGVFGGETMSPERRQEAYKRLFPGW